MLILCSNCQPFEANSYVILKIFEFIDLRQNGFSPTLPCRNVLDQKILIVELNLFYILNCIAFQTIRVYWYLEKIKNIACDW